MSNATISPPNAILFVFDPTNKDIVVPPYVDGEITAATETCVSVGTQASVDGETEVSLDLDNATPSDLHQAFFGSIVTPGGKIAVVTSKFERVLELDVPKGKANVSVWVDDLRNPAQVTVLVRPMKYQLIVQWPAASIKDYDSMIEAEDTLIARLSEFHEVDGHDAGSGEVNIFILTNDFEKAFDEVKTILQDEGLWVDTRVAYREINKSEYTILWPEGFSGFNVA